MNALEAITHLRTDLNELEARGTARPGYIRAKRTWIDAVEHQLNRQQEELAKLKERCNAEHELRLEAELRTGMLANVLTILGFDPMVHLRRPLYGHSYTNPEVYQLAAQMVCEQDKSLGIHDRMHEWKYRNRMLSSLDSILKHALWSARLAIMLRPFQHLIERNEQQEQRPAA